MKNLKLILLVLFSLSSVITFSQKDITSKIIEPLQKDAMYREKVFIHTNKTTYFVNENIWFTVYAAKDSNDTPSEYTTNLHVNLLDGKGKVIASKNVFTQAGTGVGDFLLDSKLASGKYYIQGFTNFMKNFGKKNVYLQEITIINQEKKGNVIDKQIVNKYDIQAFPESGYLLEGIKNSIGIKALINGKGTPFTGNIKNSKGQEVATITGNFLGMGKSNFYYDANENYTAELKINNTLQKTDLPKAQKIGVIFELDNKDEQKVKLTLKTNKETLPSLKTDSFSILFYRNNHISEAVNLTINNDSKTSQEFLFDKQKMLNGVNIVTLFKNNQPIAERKFFVDKLDKQSAILIEKIDTINDSITYKFKTIDSNNEPIITQLSISTLPSESKVFKEKQNIKSAFLLSPYVKGTIENPAFYFNNKNGKEKEFLDLLLLNQGWSAYNLSEMIASVNPKNKYDFESGFTIKGSIKKVPKGYDIGLLSKKNRLTTFSKFNEDNEFFFENMFAYKNDTIKVGLIKKDKPLVKPSKITVVENQSKLQDYSYLINDYNKIRVNENLNDLPKDVINFSPEAEQLDVVRLKDVKRKRKETIYDKEANIAVRKKEIAASFYQNKKVTEEIEETYRTVWEYFTHLGITKRSGWGVHFLSLSRGITSFISAGEAMNPDGTWPPKVYLDGVSVFNNNNDDVLLLQNLSMREVDEILINRSGAGGGFGAVGGIIKIYLKKGNHQYYEQSSVDLHENLVLKTGFDRAKKYYTPLYNIYNNSSLKWSEIDWKNAVNTDENGEVFIKIPTNKFSSDFQFVINGLSKNGLLFHDIYKTSEDNF